MKTVILAASICLALSGSAFAYKLDAAGKCRDDKGKFAKAEMCKADMPMHTYKLDAQKKCRNEKGKFAKAELCKA